MFETRENPSKGYITIDVTKSSGKDFFYKKDVTVSILNSYEYKQ